MYGRAGFLLTFVVALTACGFQPGVDVAGDASGDGGSGRDGGSGDMMTGGPIDYVSHTVGRSAVVLATVTAPYVPGGTYVLAVSSKPFVTVASVSGLGMTWMKIADQCGARSQTGVTVYVARGPVSAGNVVVSMTSAPISTVAVVAIYSGSSHTGTFAMYNALDASTCTETNSSVDINAYSFDIAATSRVVAAVATRQFPHTPGAGLTQRVQEMQGSSGDTAGVALVDGLVTTVAGSLTTDVDVAAIAVELRP